MIGAYLDQLEMLGDALDAPVIQGATRNKEREELSTSSAAGEIKMLVVSKVANFSIDLPEASVAIQISGTFGSRQEEAQRLGRLLRPKGDGRQAHFYTIVSRDTVDRISRPPAAVPGGAGLPLPHRGRGRPAPAALTLLLEGRRVTYRTP